MRQPPARPGWSWRWQDEPGMRQRPVIKWDADASRAPGLLDGVPLPARRTSVSRLASGPLRPEGRNDTPSPGCPTAPRSFAQAVLARSDEGRIRRWGWRGITFLFLLPQRGGRWRRKATEGGGRTHQRPRPPPPPCFARSPSPATRERTSRGHANAGMALWWREAVASDKRPHGEVRADGPQPLPHGELVEPWATSAVPGPRGSTGSP